jgi:transcriptional regulator with XRE-family HTH domain
MSDEMSSAKLGRRLRQARTAAGFSQKQLGVLAGIDESVASTRINRYEQGVHLPDVAITHRLAKALDVSAAFFYAPEDELAEFIFRLRHLKLYERREIYRSLAHLPGPPKLA